MSSRRATLMAGIPASNLALYRELQFSVGDPAALLQIPGQGRTLILRDIEMDRARRHAQVDHVNCPKDFAPSDGLSGDRETATAQSVAECLARAGVDRVVADRSLPFIYVHEIQRRGLQVTCDTEMGILERRQKTEQEVERLREAQEATENTMRMACEMVARAEVDKTGRLLLEGSPLTSERVRTAIDVHLLGLGYTSPGSIVAGGPDGADCHNLGSGELHTGQPVIIDIFPQNRETLYNGDCTRTVVHGSIPDAVQKMHQAVVTAKAAGTAATKAGATGEDVHKATIASIRASGYEVGLPGDDAPDSYCAMVHGTGHGIGLDVHEPPLLDFGGPTLLRGDALTIEPGLYSKALGGIRVEDMVVVTEDGCLNLNKLPEGLEWK